MVKPVSHDVLCGNCGELIGGAEFNAHWAQCVQAPERTVRGGYICRGCGTAIVSYWQACRCANPPAYSVMVNFLAREGRL